MPKRTIILTFVLALLLAPLLLARGEDPGPESARLKAIAAVRAEKDAAAEKAYRKALVEARREMLVGLKTALIAAMDEHDLAEANEIDHARKSVERELAALERGKLPASVASARAPVAGTYSVRHRDWQGDLTLYEDGRFGRPEWGAKHRHEGTWTFVDGTLTLAWTHWPTVRFEPRLGFEGPGSTMVRRKARPKSDAQPEGPSAPGRPRPPRPPSDHGLRPGK